MNMLIIISPILHTTIHRCFPFLPRKIRMEAITTDKKAVNNSILSCEFLDNISGGITSFGFIY